MAYTTANEDCECEGECSCGCDEECDCEEACSCGCECGYRKKLEEASAEGNPKK